MKDFRTGLYVTRISRFRAWALALLFAGALGGFAAKVQAQDQSSSDEPDFIVPSRPTVSNPAEFQKPGVLQLEVGLALAIFTNTAKAASAGVRSLHF